MRFAVLLCMSVMFGAGAVRAETAREASSVGPSLRPVSIIARLPGLSYIPTRPAPPRSVLPPVQELFIADRGNPTPGVVIQTVPPARPAPLAQNPLYRPSDHALFQYRYPLLTPDTPVHKSMLEAPKPGSAGIVELPAP